MLISELPCARTELNYWAINKHRAPLWPEISHYVTSQTTDSVTACLRGVLHATLKDVK